MTSSYGRHLIAQAPTDFHSKLWENAADERRKGKEHEARMIANDARTQKIIENESLANLLKSIEGPTTAIRKFNYSQKKAKAEKEAKEKALFAAKYKIDINNPTFDEAAKLRWRIKKGDATAQPELDLIIANLRKNGEHEAAHEIENQDSRHAVWRAELRLQELLPRLTYNAYERQLIQKNDQKGLTAWREATTDPEKIRLHNQWRIEETAYLQLDPDFVVGTIGTELKRQTETARGRQQVDTIERVTTEQDHAFKTQLELRKNQPEATSDFLDEEFLSRRTKFQDIPGGKTATQQAVDSLFQDLNALSYDGDMPLATLNGYLRHGFPHPAGKDGKGTPETVYFSKEQVNTLIQSARRGEKRIVQFARQEVYSKLNRARALRVQGQEAESNELLREVRGSGLAKEEDINDVYGINVADNTEEANAAGDVTYQKYANNGFRDVTQAVIDGTKNEKLKDRLQVTFDRIKRHDDTNDNTDDSLHKDIFEAGNPKGNFISSQSLNGDAKLISAELDRLVAPLKLRLIEAQYSTGEFVADPTINQQVNDAKRDLWVRGGGQEKGGNGRYSPDRFGGGHSNFREARDLQRKVNLEGNEMYSPANFNSWESHFTTVNGDNKDTFYDNQGQLIQKAAIENGAYLDIYDLKSAMDGGRLSDKWYHFATKLGTDVDTLFEATKKRILTNQPDDAALLGLTDHPEPSGTGKIVRSKKDANKVLHQSVDNLIQDLDIQMSDADNLTEWNTDMDANTKSIHRVGNDLRIYELKDLRFLLRTRGWSGLTDNQKQRYIVSMQYYGSQSDKQVSDQRDRERLDEIRQKQTEAANARIP